MIKEPLRCTDACGRSVADMSEAEAKAWRFLEISKRWRCPSCARELAAANERFASIGRSTSMGGGG